MEALDAAAPLPRRLWVRLATAMPFLRRIDTSFSQGHKSVVSSLRWGTLADGSGVVFSGSYDKTAKAWDERTGEAIFTHDAEANNASGFGGGGGGAVTAVELSSCGRWCFVAQRHDVSMLELPSGEVRHIVPMCEEGSEVKWIAASPDGKWLAVCVINNAAPALAIISLPGDERVPAAAVRVDAPHGAANPWFAAWSNDSRRVFTGGADGTTAAWALDTSNRRPVLEEVWRASVPDSDGSVWCGAVASGHDGDAVFTGHDDGVARRWDLRAAARAVVVATSYRGHTSAIRAVSLDPIDARSVFTGSTDCTVRQFDTLSSECLRVFCHVAGIRNLACRPVVDRDGHSSGVEFVCAGMDGVLYVWRAADDWMPRGEEAYHPVATFADIEPAEVTAKFVETIVVLLQIVGSASIAFGAKVDLDWIDAIERWWHGLFGGDVSAVVPELASSLPVPDLGASEWVPVVATGKLCLAIAAMAFINALFLTDAHGRLMAHVARLNAAGLGIKRHWHYGEVIDSESDAHRRTLQLATTMAAAARVVCGIGYIPIIRVVLHLVQCEAKWGLAASAELCPSVGIGGTAPLFAVVGLGMTFVGISTRLAMVDNDVTMLPPIPHSSWNPLTVVWHRVTRHDPPRAFLGAISLDPRSSSAFLVVQSLEKLALTLLAVAVTWSHDAERVVPWFDAAVVAVGVAVAARRPVYVVRAVSGWHLVLQLVLLLSMLAGVARLMLPAAVTEEHVGRLWLGGVLAILLATPAVTKLLATTNVDSPAHPQSSFRI